MGVLTAEMYIILKFNSSNLVKNTHAQTKSERTEILVSKKLKASHTKEAMPLGQQIHNSKKHLNRGISHGKVKVMVKC